MRCIKALVIIGIFGFIVSCEKDKIEKPPEWKTTNYISLFLDEDVIDLGNRAKLFVLNDSSFYLYGISSYNHQYRLFKVMNMGKDIKDMSSVINSYVKDIYFVNDKIGYLLENDTRMNTGDNSRLLYTDDGGDTWTEKFINGNNTFQSIHFINPDSGIALNEYYNFSYDLYYTIDGGNNWQKDTSEFFSEGNSLRNFYFIQKNPRICFLSSNGKLLYSTNGGFTWKLHSYLNMNVYSIYFLNENEGFVSDERKIYKIDRIGGNYKEIFAFNGNIIKIEAINESEIYFLSFVELYKTTNNFKSSQRIDMQDPHPNQDGDRLVVDFTTNLKRYMAVDTKGTLYMANE